jgi:hypothetical protein
MEYGGADFINSHIAGRFGFTDVCDAKDGVKRPWDKIHLTLQSMNESNHYYVILISFNIPFIFRC